VAESEVCLRDNNRINYLVKIKSLHLQILVEKIVDNTLLVWLSGQNKKKPFEVGVIRMENVSVGCCSKLVLECRSTKAFVRSAECPITLNLFCEMGCGYIAHIIFNKMRLLCKNFVWNDMAFKFVIDIADMHEFLLIGVVFLEVFC